MIVLKHDPLNLPTRAFKERMNFWKPISYTASGVYMMLLILGFYTQDVRFFAIGIVVSVLGNTPYSYKRDEYVEQLEHDSRELQHYKDEKGR